MEVRLLGPVEVAGDDGTIVAVPGPEAAAAAGRTGGRARQGDLPRPAGRHPLRRRPAPAAAQLAAGAGFAPAPQPGVGRRRPDHRDHRRRLRPGVRQRHGNRPRTLRRDGDRGPAATWPTIPALRSSTCATPSAWSVASRWPACRPTAGPGPSGPGSPRRSSRPSRTASTPSSPPAATPRWWARSSSSPTSTPCASACGRSSCWPCTAAAGRPMRCAFQDARRRLVDELGIEPGAELRRLEAAVLAQDPSLDPPAVAGAATTPVRGPRPPARRRRGSPPRPPPPGQRPPPAHRLPGPREPSWPTCSSWPRATG